MSSKRKRDWKKHSFKPPMDEASSPMHDEHVKKLLEQEKI